MGPRRMLTLAALRRYAIARSLFPPTTLGAALSRLRFVQADPLRAPARAQDLTLRPRVRGYRAGDLERRYPRLAVEEDFFINYGFLTRDVQRTLHPRPRHPGWSKADWRRARQVRRFVQERGAAHPDEVDAALGSGTARNWFGGSSRVTTGLLDALHYRGLLRVQRRENGVRTYAPAELGDDGPPPPRLPRAEAQARLDGLVDVVVGLYAPLPASSLTHLVSRLRAAAPQWADDRKRALADAKARLPHAQLDGVTWYWPVGEDPASARWEVPASVRLLAPFDPVVWDRRRFELFWGWAYRFEAYTPAARRQRGHYALPLLFEDQVIGWANLSVVDGKLRSELGFVAGKARRASGFAASLEAELDDVARFLGL